MRLTVEKIVNGGYGLSKMENGKVVLVEGAYPGEEVIVEITKEKKDVAFARTKAVLKRSPFRVIPRCPGFGKCGGCQWMDLKYSAQLELKREMVKDQLRWGGFDVEETVPSDLEFGYRTKMEFSVSKVGSNIALGLKMRYSHNVVPVSRCLISPDDFNDILEYMPKLLDAFQVIPYDIRRKTGILKHVVLKHAFTTDQTMVIFVTKTESFPKSRKIAKSLKNRFPWIHSIVHVMNSKDSVVLRGPYRTLIGEGIIVEELGWETYQIPPTAFFQSNTNVAEKLSNFVVESLDLTGRENVLDLYSGVGLFSLKVSSRARRVIGVESSRVSVKASRANANVNRRYNVEFVEADVEEFLRLYNKRVDAVILDPPRYGAGKEVVKELLRLSPEKIVYVSCEPSTLSRDLRSLVEKGYEVEKIVPFDMFPQTFHVETVAVLRKSRGGMKLDRHHNDEVERSNPVHHRSEKAPP